MNKQTHITRTALLKYTLLPGIWPRTRDLFGQGFRTLPYLIANLFFMLRLLPPAHPYLQTQNFGNFSALAVLREAARHLEPGWKNSDKFLAFFAVLAGLVMLVIQFALMIVALIIAPANAQSLPTSYEGFFSTPYPKEDLAFRMIDLVFGIPGLFGLDKGGAEPFHLALQALFQFYSFGILLIGIFLIAYIVTVIVAETAQSGIPFGKRFNKAWAPVRLILFFGLLIPITHGLNGAQYIVFLSAKGGSGLATNGWKLFNDTIGDTTYLGERESLIYKPRPADIISLPAYIMLAKTCKKAVGYKKEKDVQAWVIMGNRAEPFGSKTFQSITAELAESGTTSFNVKVRFGEQNPAYKDEPGQVTPDCGELLFYTSDISEPGSAIIQQAYYEMVQALWSGSGSGQSGHGGNTGSDATTIERIGDDIEKYATAYFRRFVLQDDKAALPPPEFRRNWYDLLENHMSGRGYTVGAGKTEYGKDDSGGVIGKAVSVQAEEGDLDVEEGIIRKGWAGAAIWYNKIAQQNGAIVSSVRNFPTPSRYPLIMEYVADKKAAASIASPYEDTFNPVLPGKNGIVEMEEPGDESVAKVLNYIWQYWVAPENNSEYGSGAAPRSQNIIVDVLNLFLGTSGLFDMCQNAGIHPMAQLAAVGKGMVDTAVRGFATGAIMGIGGGILSLVSPVLGEAGFAASGFIFTFAGLGLMIGFILFYLVPFFPFIYFFFAAGDWLKGLFEAIVGAPLWALGHLRIDSEGMVGEAAQGGYFMVLEIFLRPILIIFGLLASLMVFSAMVRVLNDIFYLVIATLPAGEEGAGFCFTDTSEDYTYVRGPIDEFFYTVVYAVVVYLIAMSSFKLIDTIPKNIMRWMGEEVAAFADQTADPAQGLMQRVAFSGMGLGERLESGFGNVTDNLKGGMAQLAQTMQR